MNEQKFKTEMRRAKLMMESDSDRASHWSGYMRGLRRGHHGENFGTDEEHQKYLDAINSRDESRKQLGVGYHEGLKYVEFSTTMGRPSVGDVMLPAITVRDDIKSSLQSVADKLGLSTPDARREAYQEFINKNQ